MSFLLFIFDLDDTLYCEHDYVRSGFLAVAEELSKGCNININKIHQLLIGEWKQNGRGRIFNNVSEQLGIEIDIPSLVQVYRRHVPQLTLYEDAQEFIDLLRVENKKMALITDGDSQMQWAKIKALDLEKWFDCIVVTGDLGKEHWKPSETPYRKVVDCLGVPFEECVYIGDNPNKDFITARKLGMGTIRIVREIGDHMETRLTPDYEADRIIYSLYDIVNDIRD